MILWSMNRSVQQQAGSAEDRYLAGEDKGDLLWQLQSNALHAPIRHRVCAAVLAPARQVLLCWRTILHCKIGTMMSALPDSWGISDMHGHVEPSAP